MFIILYNLSSYNIQTLPEIVGIKPQVKEAEKQEKLSSKKFVFPAGIEPATSPV
jgi:hypothetical protein